MTTQQDIRNWFNSGVKEGATHMIVVCDTYDWSDYPVYTTGVNETMDTYNKYATGRDMQMVVEVYDLSMNMDEQLSAGRVFNLPK